MATDNLPLELPGLRPLTSVEYAQRLSAYGCLNTAKPECAQMIHVGIFFDGTNNNMQRDKLDVPDPNKRSHTNVVTLYTTFKDDPADGFYRFYVPGVGTPFPDLGEQTESDDGKAYGSGGDERINWALIQLVNAMHRSMHDDKRLVNDKAAAGQMSDVGKAAASWPLYEWTSGNNLGGKQAYFLGHKDKDGDKVEGLLSKLQKKLAFAARSPKPKLALVNLSVFGFSRGAAQARAFCYFLDRLLEQQHENLIDYLKGKQPTHCTFAGVPLRIQFLGLFDTVASVGLADSSPTHRGFGGWANGTLDVPPLVERCVHFVASHEIRHSFPLSSARTGKAYPANCLEVAYPGAHSDVGGGYAPGSQGKASEGRAHLLSQVPLVHMYHEARVSGVPLFSLDELVSTTAGKAAALDLQIAPRTAQLFNQYAHWSQTKAGTVEASLHHHQRLYWQVRHQQSPHFNALKSYARCSEQHRYDLWESERDFRRDEEAMRSRRQLLDKHMTNKVPSKDITLLEDYESAIAQGAVPPEIDSFFDELVHDSHATFYMLGPTTVEDTAKFIADIKKKRDANDKLLPVEQRIYDYQKTNPGRMPLLTDADTEQLLSMLSIMRRNAEKHVMNIDTRREHGGHVHYRVIYDTSN